MNLSVHRPMPFHSQYSRSSAANTTKKNDGNMTSTSFQDILQEKLKAGRDRQPAGTNPSVVPAQMRLR